MREPRANAASSTPGPRTCTRSAGLVAAGALAFAGASLAPDTASALYLYAPNVLVVATPDDADAWLEGAEIAIGVQSADEPVEASRRALRRVDRVTAVMEAHWAELDASCDPNAVFALMYLVTTYGIRDHIEEAYFADGEYLATITVAFAQLYLDAYDAWVAGAGRVPAPWKTAFDWARSGKSSVLEDQFLGMNAHINHDLSIAIASLGTTDAFGGSRKPDMDRVNHVLADVTDEVDWAVSTYYGPKAPTTTPSDEHVTATNFEGARLVLPPVYAWREQAWHQATLLEAADTLSLRAALVAQLELTSNLTAQPFKTPKLVSPAPARRAYCLANPAP